MYCEVTAKVLDLRVDKAGDTPCLVFICEDLDLFHHTKRQEIWVNQSKVDYEKEKEVIGSHMVFSGVYTKKFVPKTKRYSPHFKVSSVAFKQ